MASPMEKYNSDKAFFVPSTLTENPFRLSESLLDQLLITILLTCTLILSPLTISYRISKIKLIATRRPDLPSLILTS